VQAEGNIPPRKSRRLDAWSRGIQGFCREAQYEGFGTFGATQPKRIQLGHRHVAARDGKRLRRIDIHSNAAHHHGPLAADRRRNAAGTGFQRTVFFISSPPKDKKGFTGVQGSGLTRVKSIRDSLLFLQSADT
jgi:hypothetical protein